MACHPAHHFGIEVDGEAARSKQCTINAWFLRAPIQMHGFLMGEEGGGRGELEIIFQ